MKPSVLVLVCFAFAVAAATDLDVKEVVKREVSVPQSNMERIDEIVATYLKSEENIKEVLNMIKQIDGLTEQEMIHAVYEIDRANSLRDPVYNSDALDAMGKYLDKIMPKIITAAHIYEKGKQIYETGKEVLKAVNDFMNNPHKVQILKEKLKQCLSKLNPFKSATTASATSPALHAMALQKSAIPQIPSGMATIRRIHPKFQYISS